jgi:hypothetical protein
MSHLSVRLREGERANLERRAKEVGLSLSAFARKLLVDDAPSPLEERLESLESQIAILAGGSAETAEQLPPDVAPLEGLYRGAQPQTYRCPAGHPFPKPPTSPSARCPACSRVVVPA